MKNLRLGLILIAGGWIALISFQNCAMKSFETELADGSDSVTNFSKRNFGKNSTAVFMPEVSANYGTINVGVAGTASTSTTPLSVSSQGSTSNTSSTTSTPLVGSGGQANGATATRDMNLPAGAAQPAGIKIRAMNGCGSIEAGINQTVEYHLTTGECNNSVSNFVVSAEGDGLSEAFVCFVRASQTISSTKSAPEKCLFTAEMIQTSLKKLVWYSSTFFAFDGIAFEDYRVEIYKDRAMKVQVGMINVGLRFPILKDGNFFDVPTLEKKPEYGWTSSQGDLVFLPACGGAVASALPAGWQQYNYPVRDMFGRETSETCFYKIGRRANAPSSAKKSCQFAGGVVDGYSCKFAPASADHLKKAVSQSLSGGIGSIEGTCSDGKWTDVVVNCSPAPKKSCFFNGYVEGQSCVFEATTAGSGETKTSQVLSGGSGSITGTCNDGQWTNVSGSCSPKASCEFEGGQYPGCRGTFAKTRALHGNSQVSYASENNAIVGSVSAVCNNGEWKNVVLKCQ